MSSTPASSVPDPAAALLAAWRAELPDVLGSTSELTKRVLLLAGALAAATRAELPAFGLTEAEFDVLVTLRRVGAPYRLKPHDLARSLLLSTGGTSNVTASLVRRGMVEREEDPHDGRSSWVRLTPAGAALAAAAVRATSAAHARVFDAVPAEVVLAATDGLREVFANADLAPRAGAARGRRVSAGGY